MISDQPHIRWRSMLWVAAVLAVGLALAALARAGSLVSAFWLLSLALPFLALGAAAALRHDWAWTPPVGLVAAGRVLVAGLAFAWGFAFFGELLSWGDPTLRALALSLGVGALYLLPAAITAFLGDRPGPMARRVLLLILLAWLCAYGWLRGESWYLTREAVAERRSVHAQRHWPFAGSSVSYSPPAGVHWHD
ncbi:MAG TPA: hypothetical protein VD886_15555 [Herpetosiphonaceae bacterium]|nr:hypothetical protein [Herpetosiphonaceae bacterium]